MKSFSVKSLLAPAAIALCAGIVLEVVALIVYSLTGITDFNETLSTPVLVFVIVAIVFAVIALALKAFALNRFFHGLFDLLPFAGYLIALLGFIYYVGSQVNYLTNVFVAIDGQAVSVSFVLTFATLLLASIAFLLSGIFLKKEKRDEEGENA